MFNNIMYLDHLQPFCDCRDRDIEQLKGLAQAKIVKISVILFWLNNMTI